MKFIRFSLVDGEDILINIEQIVSIKPIKKINGKSVSFSEIELSTSNSVIVETAFISLVELVKEWQK
ncbi:hypothetical protein AO053_03445 [Haemophilus influenzae biotype aegyptius]|nr:hypothetical protein [Haemophilus influenzae]TMQ39381.1 hypothetical protein AO053_03445 [Haemophilus influenzae biotype aegyptius]TMQ40956.1 hypothetical protein AO051_00210 [Haemophilus influenzae biotype aegyptius]TMQ41433.1 hypothetical protein AO052_00635 [Haemophilus influenzae biotype aegyptius]TMQ44031.1 hypothetical protein AO049_07010 [Haemophilus influenzae biotype aegyptius]TMQ46319.1 hypothetical protein AO050_00050 [Haemophilus influenzae biotype aegyptius]